jgi:uncharacterized protein (TIGR02118 family)
MMCHVDGESVQGCTGFDAMEHMYFDSIERFQASFGARRADSVTDRPNYANIPPVLQISGVKMSVALAV